MSGRRRLSLWKVEGPVVQTPSVSSPLLSKSMADRVANSPTCASRVSDGVYLLVFTTVSVGSHALQPPVFQDSRVLYILELVQGNIA